MADGVVDANAILQQQRSKLRSTEVQLDGSQPASIDLALLAVYDPNPLLEEDYSHDKEQALQSTARKGVQLLMNQIFSQPTRVTLDGVYATLPTQPTFILPREKSLPKPKAETKWQKFAKSKGIAPKPKRDRLVYDEEKQDWVPRWGYKGKNKDAEEQWIHEVPANKDASFDPIAAAKAERKARKLKNEGQRLKNVERAQQASLSKSATSRSALPAGLAALEQPQASTSKVSSGPDAASKKQDLQRLLKATRASTASLGKFDKVLDSEEKVIGKQGQFRGTKRKFADNLQSANDERQRALSLIKTLDSSGSSKKAKTDSVVNERKAIRAVSKGQGSAALASKGDAKKSKGKRR